VLAPPETAAQNLHGLMVGVLKLLNADEMEAPDVPGLEMEELQHMLTRRGFPYVSLDDTRRAVTVLVGNRYAHELTDPRYTWTRSRTVTNRFTITTDGKAYLLYAIRRVGRV
jgi:hypothetical protein